MKGMDPLEIPIKHHFSQGVYAREMFIPIGALVVGKIHKHDQLNILSKGDVTFVTEDGPQRVTAGFHMVATPGAKRAFYAHEDSIWTVIHGTEEKDVEKIELHFVAQTEAEYLEYQKLIEENKCPG